MTQSTTLPAGVELRLDVGTLAFDTEEVIDLRSPTAILGDEGVGNRIQLDSAGNTICYIFLPFPAAAVSLAIDPLITAFTIEATLDPANDVQNDPAAAAWALYSQLGSVSPQMDLVRTGITVLRVTATAGAGFVSARAKQIREKER